MRDILALTQEGLLGSREGQKGWGDAPCTGGRQSSRAPHEHRSLDTSSTWSGMAACHANETHPATNPIVDMAGVCSSELSVATSSISEWPLTRVSTTLVAPRFRTSSERPTPSTVGGGRGKKRCYHHHVRATSPPSHTTPLYTTTLVRRSTGQCHLSTHTHPHCSHTNPPCALQGKEEEEREEGREERDGRCPSVCQ
jgi:hypothetical protein